MAFEKGDTARVSWGHDDLALAGTDVTVEAPPNLDGMVRVTRQVTGFVHVDDLHEVRS